MHSPNDPMARAAAYSTVTYENVPDDARTPSQSPRAGLAAALVSRIGALAVPPSEMLLPTIHAPAANRSSVPAATPSPGVLMVTSPPIVIGAPGFAQFPVVAIVLPDTNTAPVAFPANMPGPALEKYSGSIASP